MTRLVILVSLAWLVVAPSQARTYIIKPEQITNIYDGDTITIRLDGRKERIRVLGVDTPEIKGLCLGEKMLAIKARDFTRWLLHNKSPILMEWSGKRDKYRRPLAYIFLGNKQYQNRLDNILIREKYGVEYKPRPDSFWCQ